jgi:hypothetical protein
VPGPSGFVTLWRFAWTAEWRAKPCDFRDEMVVSKQVSRTGV